MDRNGAASRSVRTGLYVLLGFVIVSLILGTWKGNSFVDNIVYGLWTGALSGAIVGVIAYTVRARRN